MTLEECRAHLPNGWTEAIQRDSVLLELFEEHEYELGREEVPPFLIQSLRGGDLERLRPILTLCGQPRLEMLQGLLEIDEASRDTAEIQLPEGRTAYAGYFSARFSEKNRQSAVDAARSYIQAVSRVYAEELGEPFPLDADTKITVLVLSGREEDDFRMRMHREFCGHKFHPGDNIYGDLGDWCANLPYREGGPADHGKKCYPFRPGVCYNDFKRRTASGPPSLYPKKETI